MKLRIAAALIAIVCACGGGADARQDTASPAADSLDARVGQADVARIAGDTGAKVWLIMVSDFQCPYCKLWHDSTGHRIRQEYVESGKVRLAYLNYPLSQHQNALPAAEAAMCAGAQGRFWVYHDSLFASQPEWAALPDGQPVFDRLAQSAALDRAAFGVCMRDHVMRPMIEADYRRGNTQGVRGTPTFFIGARRIDNAQPFSVFKPILDSAIAASRGGGDR
jgi:protein-disulfide isomerase